ncbi:hypothetical protein FRC03_001104 [Tulasnella sp. 419]|nr:hypothetical protein FRC02_006775 [Tulasnella sp. 418]KAG8969759.1 hypothetical protein FRC03_001104 [Tulasnella sp. 419]
MTVTEVTSLDQFNEIINRDENSVFDFWATWCGPCKMISPVFEALSDNSEYAGVKFYKVDVDAVREVAAAVNVRVMPTFMLFKNGEKVKELKGANPPGLQQLLASAV